ncbi:glycosyltransferase family 4 protein [Pedobacter antarcticus]|uniref:glycosyltransferase n=1 Tax=Pedobacter antarcticus TaxID=34086 RepID=UPI00292F80C9|nr:glycosyltransferase family 4 protein [Pedobacter antarcticus]
MKKVLLFTDVDFWERCSGHRVRIAALVRYLSGHFSLTVVATGPAHGSIENTVNNEYGIELIILEHDSHLDSDDYGEKLKSLLESRHFDVLIVEYIHSSYCLNFLPYDCHVILDTHDIISERTAQFKKFDYGSRLYEMQEKDEADIFSIYDHVMMINQPDFDRACLMVDSRKVLLCPHPCEIYYHELRPEVRKIAFVASCYLPNVDSINHFMAHCWDEISAKYNVELDIYGTVCTELNFPDKKRINLKGFESSLNKIYEEADIVINPVRFGAGLKIKNLEALAHGKPLVTTSHGARGMETGANNSYSVADDDDAFVSAISDLIKSKYLRETMQRNAHDFITKYFSSSKCFKPLYDAITEFDITQ